MGNNCLSPSTPLPLTPSPDALDSSCHNSRSNYVWVRNEDVSEVYDVVKVIGLGSMGEVSVVRKRRDGNKSLRKLNSDSHNNLKVLGEREEEKKREGDRGMPSLDEYPPSLTLVRRQTSEGQKSTIDINLQKLSRKFACKTVALAMMKSEELIEFENEIEVRREGAWSEVTSRR